MARTTAPLLPSSNQLLADLGERLRLARLRRRLSAVQVAERAGMAPKTLTAIERGAAGVTIGAYLGVLQVLQLEGGLALVAGDDPLGRALQDRATTQRRARRPSMRAVTASVPAGSPSPSVSPQAQQPSAAEGTQISTDSLLQLLNLPVAK